MKLHLGLWVLDTAWLFILSFLFYHFWQLRKLLVDAQSWLRVRGHITHCEWVKAGHTFWPKVEYSYQVFDKDLIGKHLFLDTFHNNPNSKYARQVAYKTAMAYQEEAEIDVFYNPNNPDQSALDVTIPRKLNVILCLLSLFMLLQLSSIFMHFFRG